MSNQFTSKDLLPQGTGLTLLDLEKSEQGWVVRGEGRASSDCPLCGTTSVTRHSRYWRQLKDLPVQGVAVTLLLRLGKWRCRNTGCKRKIFTERLARVMKPYAYRTQRVEEIIFVVGHGMGGRPAERLMRYLAMGSVTTPFCAEQNAQRRRSWHRLGSVPCE